jgi:hypothetical protein
VESRTTYVSRVAMYTDTAFQQEYGGLWVTQFHRTFHWVVCALQKSISNLHKCYPWSSPVAQRTHLLGLKFCSGGAGLAVDPRQAHWHNCTPRRTASRSTCSELRLQNFLGPPPIKVSKSLTSLWPMRRQRTCPLMLYLAESHLRKGRACHPKPSVVR